MESHRSRARQALCSVLVLICGVKLLIENPVYAVTLRDLTEEDRARWQSFGDTLLSPDGRWLVYSDLPSMGIGDGAVIARSTQDQTEYRYPIGGPETQLKMSVSGRWIAFTTGSSDVQLVRLDTGAVRKTIGVEDFEFGGEGREWFSWRDENRTLRLVNLTTQQERSFKDVTAYAFEPHGRRVALATGSALKILELSSGRLKILSRFPTEQQHVRLTWSDSGRSLAALRGQESSALIVATRLNGTQPTVRTFEGSGWRGFPAEYEICARPILIDYPSGARTVVWRDDERGLFFPICLKPKAVTPVDAMVGAGKVIVWRSKSQELPGKRRANSAATPGYWCFASLEQGRFVLLADPSLAFVQPQKRGRYVLAYDWEKYGWLNDVNPRATQLRDYHLVDIETGVRAVVVEALPVPPGLSGNSEAIYVEPQLSPDGRYMLYQQRGDFFSYEIVSGKRRNLTAKLPTAFYYPENPPQGRHLLKQHEPRWPMMQGWTRDGRQVLLSDYYDVWSLSLDGRFARNLTGNGRSDRICYGRVLYQSGLDRSRPPADFPVDLNEAIYFQGLELDTQRTVIAQLLPRQQLKVIRWDEASMQYFQARSGSVHLYLRMTATDSPNYFLADATWRTIRPLTDLNPQQRDVRWFPSPRFLTYKTARGDILHATLYLPYGYTAGQRYPAITIIYEDQLSAVFHNYLDPALDSGRFTYWLERGYAMLRPDVVPRVAAAGAAALEGVEAAVKAAIETGVVDRNRLGLYGHSYGAFETNYIVSKTNLFKAAVAYAGVSNFWSDYGGVYGDTIPRSVQREYGQGAFGGPWWERWDAYLENSPLYHAATIRTPLLLVHGDQDRAVSFSQSVELFNTLRRMGNPSIVLLQYSNEGHDLHAESLTDLMSRMEGFFGHFLKAEPTPRWWIGN